MITKEQAMTAQNFHENGCSRIIGPKGGKKVTVRSWRRNGKTKVWVTRSEEFSVPIKFGLKACDYLTQDNANHFHLPENCPLKSDLNDSVSV